MAKRSTPPVPPIIACGPPKKRRKGPPRRRHSTHKKRSQWFRNRAAYPYRDATADHLIQQRARITVQPAAVPAAASGSLWAPTNVGGRITSLAVDPANTDVVYAGAAGGGVWRRPTVRISWASLWHSEPSLNIGALAIDAAGTLYAATGEANLSADSLPRRRHSPDSPTPERPDPLGVSAVHGLPRRIGVIAIDPFNPSHLRIFASRTPTTNPLASSSPPTWAFRGPSRTSFPHWATTAMRSCFIPSPSRA